MDVKQVLRVLATPVVAKPVLVRCTAVVQSHGCKPRVWLAASVASGGLNRASTFQVRQ